MGLPASVTRRPQVSRRNPPNPLFLISDQQRADTLRVYGNERNIAPSLNHLADRSVVFKEYYVTQPLRAIRTVDGWKMTLTDGGSGELYNLARDPEERTNLFYHKGSLPIIRELAARINLWQRPTGDKLLPFDPEGWKQRRDNYVKQGLLNADT